MLLSMTVVVYMYVGDIVSDCIPLELEINARYIAFNGAMHVPARLLWSQVYKVKLESNACTHLGITKKEAP